MFFNYLSEKTVKMIDAVSKAVWLSFYDKKYIQSIVFVLMHCIRDENKYNLRIDHFMITS